MSLSRLKKLLEKTKRNREKIEKRKAAKRLKAIFKFKPFSPKQRKLLNWWHPDSPVKHKKGIIADGAIRSGKTIALSLSFMLWAMNSFDDQNFGMAGKTIGSFRRNVVKDLKKMAFARGYKVTDRRSDSYLEIKNGDTVNRFYIFGGKDEGSQDLIQGITLAGMFFDEVVLMPKSFVDQATGRCSVDDSKLWFTCNPGNPYHWFKEEYLDLKEEKEYLHVHFLMDDNYSLSEERKEYYRNHYTGVFKKRYIEGLWVAAEGLIYHMFKDELHVLKEVPKANECQKLYMTCDYGDNATVILLVGRKDNKYYVLDEFYHSGLKSGFSKTDSQLADEVERFLKRHDINQRINFILDTNAKSFKTELNKRKKVYVKNPAKKDQFLDGIRVVQDAIYTGGVYVSKKCKELIKEFSVYAWDLKAANNGEDKPIKANDHCLDALRYLIHTFIRRDSNPGAPAMAYWS